MPNRVLKDSICMSEDINRLSSQAENLFYRLIVQADDYGCYYGDDRIIKSTCFPLRSDAINCDQVHAWLVELSSAGLIELYKGKDGRKYVHFVKWDKHQQIRAKKRKFPDPAGLYDEEELQSDDSSCNHMQSDDSSCARNPIQSNPINESNPIVYGDEKKSRSRKQFTPPTLEEVREYAESRNSSVDPDKFYDYYAAGQWKDSKGDPVRNWKQKFITWERKEEKDAGTANTGKSVSSEVHGNNQRSATSGKFSGFKYDI